MTDFDAVIIGAGHNGLICASYLAKAGKRVLVVDGRSQPGGCASTRELTPGVRVSDCAQWLHQFDDAIASDLDLKGNGLQVGSAKRTIALQADGDHLVMDGDLLRGAGISTKDQVAYKAFRSQMGVFAKLMLKLYRSRAPKLVEADWITAWKSLQGGCACSDLITASLTERMVGESYREGSLVQSFTCSRFPRSCA